MSLRGSDAMAIRDAVEKRRSGMDKIRLGFMPHWQELGEYIDPRPSHWLYNTQQLAQRGAKMHGKIINEEATFDVGILAAGMQSGLSSPSRPWFRLTTAEPGLSELHHVKLWLSSTLARMLDILHRSNCYDTYWLGHRSLGVWGTNNEGMIRDPDTFVRFRHLPIGSYWIATDKNQRVNTTYEELGLTVDQMVQRYGLESCCAKTRDLWVKNPEQPRTVYQAIEPNDERIHGAAGWRGKKYRSIHYEKDAPKDELLRVSGFDMLPFFCSRWEAIGHDPWGNSPGMNVLGSVKQLQVNELDLAMVTGKLADPPYAVPKDFLAQRSTQGMSGGLKTGELVPINEMSGSAGTRAYSLYEGNPGIMEIRQNSREIEYRIRRGFYSDVFMMMHQMDGGPQKTATEIAAKKEEKLQALGPVVDRQHNERFSPEILTLLIYMIEAGYVDPIPQELVEQPVLKIEYTSVMAQAMKTLGIDNMDRVLAITMTASQLDPTARHRLDIREFIERYAEMLGVDPSVINSDEQVERAVAQEQQMARAQQALEMAKTGAEAGRAAAQAPTGGDTLLDDAMSAARSAGAPV